MITKIDIIPDTQVQLTADISNIDQINEKGRIISYGNTLKKDTIFTLVKLSKGINPYIRIKTSDNVFYDVNLKRHGEHFNRYGQVSEQDLANDNIQKNMENILQSIKKLAKEDDLPAIQLLIEQYPEFLNNKKHARTLMGWAIASEKAQILSHGFEHDWFKLVNWNENVLTGETPLYYAMLKSTLETQMLLILHGASLHNKSSTYSPDTIHQHMYKYGIWRDKEIEQTVSQALSNKYNIIPQKEMYSKEDFALLDKYEQAIRLNEKLTVKPEKSKMKI